MLKRIARAVLPPRVRQWLQRRKLQRLAAAFPRRVVRHRYGTVDLSIELTDPLGQGWYDHDWEPLPELELLSRSRLRAGARVFDCGAHQGVVGLMLGDRVGAAGHVVLVEANPHNAEMCRQNATRNLMPWVTAEHAAISDADGQLQFNAGWNGAVGTVSDYGGLIDVPAVTIDTLTARYGPPDVVFIDVEGYECHALRGAARTAATHPDWFVEVHLGPMWSRSGSTAAEVLSHFPADRYDRFVHLEGWVAPVPLESADPTVLEARFFLTALARATDRGA
ncbi:FkbM family methyltransferase [Gemmata sp.]|uniref:FkbM family methyltransferase n=1 Tax=Gemmata sp. TaxID=1914242 RepID=UPI003F724AB8